eukprot:scaffold24_cov186-Alexandrium_tamarense.AAC.34
MLIKIDECTKRLEEEKGFERGSSVLLRSYVEDNLKVVLSRSLWALDDTLYFHNKQQLTRQVKNCVEVAGSSRFLSSA